LPDYSNVLPRLWGAILGDSKLLLTASADTTAKLWNVENGEELFSWYAPTYPTQPRPRVFNLCCLFLAGSAAGDSWRWKLTFGESRRIYQVSPSTREVCRLCQGRSQVPCRN
jgi:hypothetical protein